MNTYIRPCWRNDPARYDSQERGRKLQSLWNEDLAELFDKIADYSDDHGEDMSTEEIYAAVHEAVRDNKRRAMPLWAEFQARCETLAIADDERSADWWDRRETRAKGRRYCRRKLPALIQKVGLTLGVEHLIRDVEWSDRGDIGLTAASNKALLELPPTPAVLRLLRKHRLIDRVEKPELDQYVIDAMDAADAEIQAAERARNE